MCYAATDEQRRDGGQCGHDLELAGMRRPSLIVGGDGARAVIRLEGDLVTAGLGAVEREAAAILPAAATVEIDLSAAGAIDTGGAWLVTTLDDRLRRAGRTVSIGGLTAARRDFLETVRKARPAEPGVEAPPRGLGPWLAALGARSAGAGEALLSYLSFFGLTLHRLGRTAIRPRRLRGTALVSQMETSGLNAVPIVVLMSFLIGVVLAFQGAAQLRQFGAEVFVVDLIAVSILRELGILLTAIIVAGRSGSAYTAAIGSMKVNQEIDAMHTLGLDPIEVLVLPRLLALVLMLPVLGCIANLSGLLGGALMSWAELGVSPSMFLTRLQNNTDVWHLAIGMIKAPFFAVAIAVTACWQGMLVGGSAESVGNRTTASVVQAIFLVIALDAAFSILFAELGL
jgi:phospholipid/cholesterol/gamma-HCH transport system permease protein